MNQVLGSLQSIFGTARLKQFVPKEMDLEHIEKVPVFLQSCYLHLHVEGPENQAQPSPASWEGSPKQLRPRCSLSGEGLGRPGHVSPTPTQLTGAQDPWW